MDFVKLTTAIFFRPVDRLTVFVYIVLCSANIGRKDNCIWS